MFTKENLEMLKRAHMNKKTALSTAIFYRENTWMIDDPNCALMKKADKINIWRMAHALIVATHALEFYEAKSKGEVDLTGSPLFRSRAAEALECINLPTQS